jgi:hypothetical protein
LVKKTNFIILTVKARCLGYRISNNLLPTRTQHRHTHQITDQDDCRPGQSEKNDEEVKGERGVKVRRVQENIKKNGN